MKVVRPRVSYADLQQTPEDGRRYELYDGQVFVVPSPLPIHQIVVKNLAFLLRTYSEKHGGISLFGPLDIVFSDFDVLQPDVVFFSESRRRLVDPQQPIRHAPDLVVEVLSPSTEATDRGRKMQMFARYRVPEYWIVDPSTNSVEIYGLADEGYALVQVGSGDEVVLSPQ